MQPMTTTSIAVATAPIATAPRAWQSKSEWEALVENIAQSHARLASGIQLAIEKQWGNNFTACLQAYASAKESEIRGVCSANYQEFVDSIEEIVRMKADVAKLQRDIDRFQHELASATSDVLAIHDALDACYGVQRDIDASIEKLQQCQRIAGLATTIDMYIQQSKLFHALKVLEELRSEIAGFRGQLFPQRMNDWMHTAMETIKEEAKRSVSTWLEDIRAAAHSIGELAIARFENQVSAQYYEQDMLDKCGLGASPSTPRPTSSSSAAVAPRLGTNRTNSTADNEPLRLPSLKVLNSDADVLRATTTVHATYMAQTRALLAPMLRVLHVFRAMHQVPELAAFYNANRLPQLQLQSFLTGDVAMITPERFVAQHDELFAKVTGAFCLEHLLCRDAHAALVTTKELNGLFHLLVQSVCGIVTATLLRIDAPHTILAIKQSATRSARALSDEVHAYNATALLDTFRRLGAHFRHSVLADTTRQLREFMTTDTFEHVRVAKRELPEVLALCGIDGQEATLLTTVDLSADPIVLPFSDVVIKSCRAVDAFVQMMFDYERYLTIHDWGDAVRDDTIEALGALNDVLNEVIDERADLQVAMAVMMGVNASVLASACDRFDAVVTAQTAAWDARTIGVSVSTLLRHAPLATPPNANANASSRPLVMVQSKAGAKKKFESTTTRAQDMVCELMLKKIDELLASFYYLNWTPAAASLQPDPSMWDLITYLRVTFAPLAQLPTATRDAIHFATCIHIAKSLEQLLVGSAVRKLNGFGLANLQRNVDALLAYVDSIGIEHLGACFLALTQLLELVLSGHADKFLDPHQREVGKYSHLSVETVASVLEKVRDTAKPTPSSRLWGGASSSATSANAPKKTSLLGSVVKTLRK